MARAPAPLYEPLSSETAAGPDVRPVLRRSRCPARSVAVIAVDVRRGRTAMPPRRAGGRRAGQRRPSATSRRRHARAPRLAEPGPAVAGWARDAHLTLEPIVWPAMIAEPRPADPRRASRRRRPSAGGARSASGRPRVPGDRRPLPDQGSRRRPRVSVRRAVGSPRPWQLRRGPRSRSRPPAARRHRARSSRVVAVAAPDPQVDARRPRRRPTTRGLSSPSA